MHSPEQKIQVKCRPEIVLILCRNPRTREQKIWVAAFVLERSKEICLTWPDGPTQNISVGNAANGSHSHSPSLSHIEIVKQKQNKQKERQSQKWLNNDSTFVFRYRLFSHDATPTLFSKAYLCLLISSRLEWWSNFCCDAMAMVFFRSDAILMFFGHTLPSLLMQWFGLNHRWRCFSMFCFFTSFGCCLISTDTVIEISTKSRITSLFSSLGELKFTRPLNPISFPDKGV